MPGLQKIPKETILAAIAKLGPCQPIDIRKELKQGDTFLIGAMLSELVAEGALVISKTRRGGSPFYYDPKVPESLERVSQYLNEKDRRTCAMLREAKVLREDAVEPLVRVGLQSIHDFAQRMVVNDRGQEVVYWRYFLTPEPEALRMIKGSQRDATGAEQKAEKAERVKDADSVPERKPSDATPGDTKSKDQESKDEAREVQEPRADAPAKEGLKKEDAVRPAKSEEIKLPSPAMHEPEAKAEPKKRAPKTKSAAFPAAPSQPSLQDWLIHDTLYEKVQIFAVGQKGIITHQQSIKPNAELTCMLTNDGPYGRLSVMVYAVNKKKVAEKDITQALLQARGHGVPLLVLSVEEIPVKITKSFESTLNIYFRKF